MKGADKILYHPSQQSLTHSRSNRNSRNSTTVSFANLNNNYENKDNDSIIESSMQYQNALTKQYMYDQYIIQRRKLKYIVTSIIACTILFVYISLYIDGDTKSLANNNAIAPIRSYYKPFFEIAKECNNGLYMENVKQGAKSQRSLYMCEMKFSHPCCFNTLIKTKLDNILFVILNITNKEKNYKNINNVFNTWARGLSNVVIIEMINNYLNKIESIDIDNIELSKKLLYMLDIQLTKDIFTMNDNISWIVIANSSTWINIPSLIEFLQYQNPKCPTAFGYVNKGLWMESIEFFDINSGIVLSRSAYIKYTQRQKDSCLYQLTIGYTLSKCLWASNIQFIHSNTFTNKPIQRTNDRHKTIIPNTVVESISIPYMYALEDLKYITMYSFSRWGYNTPNGDDAFLPYIDKTVKPISSKDIQKEFNYLHFIYATGDDIQQNIYTVYLDDLIIPNNLINPLSMKSTNDIDTNTTDNNNPYDYSKMLDNILLVPKIMYPKHLDPYGQQLENAIVGYNFFNIPYPSEENILS